jgi:hypothetical protein
MWPQSAVGSGALPPCCRRRKKRADDGAEAEGGRTDRVGEMGNLYSQRGRNVRRSSSPFRPWSATGKQTTPSSCPSLGHPYLRPFHHNPDQHRADGAGGLTGVDTEAVQTSPADNAGTTGRPLETAAEESSGGGACAIGESNGANRCRWRSVQRVHEEWVTKEFVFFDRNTLQIVIFLFHSPSTLSTSKTYYRWVRRKGYGGPELNKKNFQLSSFLIYIYTVLL